MNTQVAVLGAGAYGTAIARTLTYAKHDVTLWTHSPRHVRELADAKENSRLPGIRLPDGLEIGSDLESACLGKDALIFAVPSIYLMEVLRGILSVEDVIEAVPRIASVTKGFIPGTRGTELVLQAMENYLPGAYKDRLVYISGPSHAEEMGRDKLTGLICASTDPKNALWFRNLFRVPSLMVFPSLDVVGVQVCAAVKNVVAIAFGMLDALKEIDPLVGDNTESLLFAAGLNEIQTLGIALGATHPETFTSIAGVGDLDVTCHSAHGRNRRFGRQIVLKGILESFRDIDDLISRIDEIGYLPEGIPASKYAWGFARERSLKLPVLSRVYRILNREMEPLELIDSFRVPAERD